MRKIIVICIMLMAVGISGQSGNRFVDEERSSEMNGSYGGGYNDDDVSPQSEDDDGPPNVGDPTAPINDYLPLLFIVGVGIIALSRYRKKAMSS